MNCKDVEELLPLYVGRDLKAETARDVGLHMQSCLTCASAAGEYGETAQLLQMFEAPQFSDATYAALRANVLREIEQHSTARQSRFAWSFPKLLFQPRFMWAVSTVVLIAVCAFAYYFIANRTSELHQEQANRHQETNPAGTAGLPPAVATGPLNSTLNLASKTTGSPSAPGSRGRRSNLAVRVLRYSAKAGGTPAVPVNTSATAGKTLRLEIQTSDPNIRIIWFSQPTHNVGAPIESSKGI
jgi:hypothetical protein